ncbi:MAG: hypothetical protein ACUVUD_05245 [bacterium]
MNNSKRVELLLILLLFAACDNLFPPGDFEPTGTPFSFNPGITTIAITGNRRAFSDKGIYTVEIRAQAPGSSALLDTLPGGLIFTSTKNSTQHLLVLKDHLITVNPSPTSLIVGVFCCNRYREIPAEDDTFLLGPLTDNNDLRQLVQLVKTKNISQHLGMVQRAVWTVTDSNGLSPAYIDSINALPPQTDGHHH